MKKTNGDFERILIVRTDRIGDVILTTPSIHALRSRYPHAFLAVLVSPASRCLVEGNPDVNEVLCYDRQNGHRGWRGCVRLIHALRQRRFDCAIIYHTKKRAHLLCFLAGIPERIGYRTDKFGFLLTHQIPDDRSQGKKHEAQYCLDVLKHLTVTGDPHDVFIPLHPQEESWAQQWFLSQGVPSTGEMIALHPGASCPTKKWPEERFAELMGLLARKYQKPLVLVGGPDQRSTAEKIISLLPAQVKVFDLIGQTTLSQLASLLKRCWFMVSNDSGPVHLADGLGTPVISIFTRDQPGINPTRWKPLSEKSGYIAPKGLKPTDFSKGEVEDRGYLYAITAEQVLQVVDAKIKLC